MGDYRVTGDGVTWACDSEDYARRYRDYLSRNKPGTTYTIQRRLEVWEDVPEPEPLPANLPAEVWAHLGTWGEVHAHAYRINPTTPKGGKRRLFRGTVTEWVEVTE